MIRFLFCSAAIIPVFFLPGVLQGSEADATPEAKPNTYVEFTNEKLEHLQDCESDSIGIYFHETYVTTHSAEYLQSAVDAVSHCDTPHIKLINLVQEDATPDETKLAKAQADEIEAFVESYDLEADLDRITRSVEANTRTVNGRAVLVEFDFDNDESPNGSSGANPQN